MLVRYHNKKGTAKSEYFETYVKARLEKIQRPPFSVLKVDVCTSKEGAFYSVEVCVLGKIEVRASASTNDLTDSFDRAVDKIISQVNKLKLSTHGFRRERRKAKRELKNEIMENAGFLGEIKKIS